MHRPQGAAASRHGALPKARTNNDKGPEENPWALRINATLYNF